MEQDLTVDNIGALLEQETTVEWRSERNGRVCEMLLSGARTNFRKRMRRARLDEVDVDPHIVVKVDVENVIKDEFQ